MIKSFAHKGLEKYFLAGSAAGVQAIHGKRLRLILAQLDKAKSIDDMDIPTLHLYELKGSRKGIWSVTVQANGRVTFRFVDGDAEVVNYEDYYGEAFMQMHNPPHPGEILQGLWLDPKGISITEAAQALGVSRKTLSKIVNGRGAVTPEMAVRLARAFSTSPESWLAHQAAYDLWQLRQVKIRVQKLAAGGICAV